MADFQGGLAACRPMGMRSCGFSGQIYISEAGSLSSSLAAWRYKL